MATSTFNPQEIELRRKLLNDELAALEAEKIKSLGGMQLVDYHHPERSPGWPIYNINDPRNKFPQLLYHPTEKDERIERVRLGLRRRNEANPTLAPMDIPPSECRTMKVASAREREEALAAGYVEKAPQQQMLDNNSPPELVGATVDNMLVNSERPSLSVETIIKLNMMSKEELVKTAFETYRISLPETASKVEIITAIQERELLVV